MDANTDHTTEQAAPIAKPVMDIQPPSTPAPATTTDDPIDQPTVEPVTSVAETPELTVTDAPVASEAESVPVQTPATQHAKRRVPLAAVLVAIVVAIGLGALTIITYTTSHTATSTASRSTTTTTTNTAATPNVTASDVETTSTDLDNSLKQVDEATDFNSADLSDTGLDL